MFALRLLAALFLLCSASPAAAYTLSFGQVVVAPGDPAVVPLFLDVAVGEVPTTGFTFGALIPGSAIAGLSTSNVLQGLDLGALNEGDGADFFALNTNPVGAGGEVAITLGTVYSFLGGEELGVGTHHIVDWVVSVPATVPVGTRFDVEFSGSLGNPVVPVQVSITSGSFTPVQVAGEILVPEPPPLAVACTALVALLALARVRATSGRGMY